LNFKRTLIWLVALLLFTSPLSFVDHSFVNAAEIDSIPNTTRTMKDYDHTFLSVTGYASLGVNDRSHYIDTPFYRQVKTEREFLQAILDAGKGSVKVIEVAKDLNLGWKALNLSSDEAKKYGFIRKYRDPMNGFTNPNLASSGVSQLDINNINGLTIFSKKGKTIRSAEFKLQRSVNDIVIRNLSFDGMWQWDDTGKHKEVGWSFIKVNGANNVWIDHCKFSIAADGLIDTENGGSNITISWTEFGLPANEHPSEETDIYQSIQHMEGKYASNQLNTDSVYYNMREGGATKEQIMAYAAYHSKVHLSGSGDKDYVNYVSSSGNEIKDGNQRIRLTLAYNRYTNIGQRIPMIRQGTGHMYNCYLDNSSHYEVLDNVSAIAEYGTDTLSRALNARNGASIAADTCVFQDITEPITGAELQGLDTKNMDEQWAKLFQSAYNRNLIVNSHITNKYGTYTGSSWDNNGENLFNNGFTWYDKSTIGNWAWSSHIVGSESMSKSNPPTDPFTFEYHSNEKLPYTYQVLPLNNVVATLTKFAGPNKVNLSPIGWLQTDYHSKNNSEINNE
jgi:pectate lyase